jgi:hypothetical protein
MKISDLYQSNPHLSEVCFTSIANTCKVDQPLLCTNVGRTYNVDRTINNNNPQQQQQDQHYYPSPTTEKDNSYLLFGMFPVHCDIIGVVQDLSSYVYSFNKQPLPPQYIDPWDMVRLHEDLPSSFNNNSKQPRPQYYQRHVVHVGDGNDHTFPPAPKKSYMSDSKLSVLVMPTVYSDNSRKPVLSQDDDTMMSPSCITSSGNSSSSSNHDHHGYNYTYEFCHEQSFTIQAKK